MFLIEDGLMLGFLIDLSALIFCLAGALFWFLMWRGSWIGYLSALIGAVGVINFFADVSGVFSIGAFVLGLAITLYAAKFGGLDDFIEEVKIRRLINQKQVVNNKQGQVRGKLGVYEFDYYDQGRNKTRRKVEVNRLYYEMGVGYFEGYCFKRKAARTFRLDRVAGDVIDLSTGEIVRLGNE